MAAAVTAALAACMAPPAKPPAAVTSRNFPLRQSVELIAASPDGERVVLASHGIDGTNVLHVYTRANHETSQVILRSRVRALTMLTAATALLAGDDGALTELTWLPGNLTRQRELMAPGSPQPTFLVAIDEHRALLANTPWPPRPQGASLMVIDTTGEPPRELRPSSPVPHWLDLIAAGEVLFGLDGRRLWRCDLAADSVFALQGDVDDSDPGCLAPGPDAGVLLGGVEVHERRRRGEEVPIADAGGARVRQLRSSRDGTLAAWIDTDDVVHVARRGAAGSWTPVVLPGSTENIRAVVLDPAGRYVVLGNATKGYDVLELAPPTAPPSTP